ncbi:MAG: hypothetical protein ACREBR_03375, partial [bacterium]
MEEEKNVTAEFNIVFDTGASVAVTPDRNDFIGELRAPPTNLVLKGISRGLPVQGIGTIRWYVMDDCDRLKVIETEAYYVPDIPIRLFSPQSYVTGPSRFTIQEHYSVLTWDDGNKMTLLYHPRSRLPIARGY